MTCVTEFFEIELFDHLALSKFGMVNFYSIYAIVGYLNPFYTRIKYMISKQIFYVLSAVAVEFTKSFSAHG